MPALSQTKELYTTPYTDVQSDQAGSGMAVWTEPSRTDGKPGSSGFGRAAGGSGSPGGVQFEGIDRLRKGMGNIRFTACWGL